QHAQRGRARLQRRDVAAGRARGRAGVRRRPPRPRLAGNQAARHAPSPGRGALTAPWPPPTPAPPLDLPRPASVVIIGGGVVGCSIAYHLARRGQHDVVVLERDAVGSGTTSKAAGGIRAQFSTETEIRFSLESIQVFERFRDEFGVDPGY